MKLRKDIFDSYKFPLVLILSIILGSFLGITMKDKAKIFKPLGDIFINGMFTLVVPLVFTTISSSISSMGNMKRLKSILFSLFSVFIGTGLIASIIIICVVKIFPPGSGAKLIFDTTATIKPFDAGSQIVSALTVTDFYHLLEKKNMLPLILFSIFFGFAINLIGEKGEIITKGLNALSEVFLKMIGIFMFYAPIGLGAYFANLVGVFGKDLLGAYGKAMGIYYPLCFLYFIILFPIYGYIAGGKKGVFSLKNLLAPALTSLATQSSMATLPVNLKAAENIGVPEDIRNIVLPIGASAHMDGTCLSSILKISFLFGIFNIPFEGTTTYLTAILLSIMGGVVMSGIPGGGLIGEMLIVNIYGFPPEAFPIIATIGYLVDPPATMINATGDTVAAMLVARIVEGKNWCQYKKEKNANKKKNFIISSVE